MQLLNYKYQYSKELDNISNQTSFESISSFNESFFNYFSFNQTLDFRTDLNNYEKFGILFACIYFCFGFPTNLISIVICFRSLFQKYLLSLKIKRLRRKERNVFFNNINNNPQSQPKVSIEKKNKEQILILIDNKRLNNLFILDNKERNKNIKNQSLIKTRIQSDSYVITSNFKDRKHLKRNKSLESNSIFIKPSIDPNSGLNQTQGLKNSERVCKNQLIILANSNPHRKCFELFLIEISFCDIIILTYNLIEWILLLLSRNQVIPLYYEEPVLISPFMCRFVISLNRTVILLHNWLMVSLAATRCYAIYKPINSNSNFGSKFYLRLNLIVFTFLLAIIVSSNIYGVYILSFTPMVINNEKLLQKRAHCKISQEVYAKYQHIEAYINIGLGVIGYSLPCFVTLIINLVLIYNLRNIDSPWINKSNYNIKENVSLPSKIDDNELTSEKTIKKFNLKSTKRQSQFVKTTSSLIIISFAYLICNLPYTFCFLFISLGLLQFSETMIYVVTWIRYLNHSLNFYIYYLTGERFRKDVNGFFKV